MKPFSDTTWLLPPVLPLHVGHTLSDTRASAEESLEEHLGRVGVGITQLLRERSRPLLRDCVWTAERVLPRDLVGQAAAE